MKTARDMMAENILDRLSDLKNHPDDAISESPLRSLPGPKASVEALADHSQPNKEVRV